ncbi:pilus assembly protein PilM [Paenibacillus qinlingensis]|uniref:pilus assembly protein PilM n=1 Tax=Paenibacillus qinlingensis TaxID=1837343 RepID=UPI001564589C|nr:pilus assembly protein PilM [Paenibacillus qinlingensis]NQX63242.1 pilus assembly protein PilM [Paenibacillus qinlingensis]
MFGLGNKRIGITIDQTGVRYVTIKKKKSWEIGTSGYLPIPPGIIVEDHIMNSESLSLQVKHWVKTEKIRGASATLAIPTSQIIIRKMRIPSIKAAELSQLVELEVETALRLPFEDPVYDFIKVGHDDESTQVLVFAAPKKLIQSYVDVFEDAGIHVRAVEISATALARAISAHQQDFIHESMLISLDRNSLEVYMLQYGNPIFMRTISLMDHAAMDTDELTSDQVGEIIAEISRMLSFYQYSIQEGASRISHIIVTGANETRIQLHRELQLGLSELHVDTVDFDTLTKSRFKDFNANAFRVAAGVAMFSKRNAYINLQPHRKTETRIKLFVLWIFVVAWIACMGISGYTYWENSKEMKANTSKLVQLNQNKAILEAKLLVKPELSSDPANFIATMKASRKDVVVITNDLMKPLPVDGRITTMAYSADSQISLTVLFTKMEDSARYLYDLRKLTFGENALLQSITESVNGKTTLNGAADSSSSTEDRTDLNVNLSGDKQYVVNYSISLKKEAAKDSANKAATTDVKGAAATNVQQK